MDSNLQKQDIKKTFTFDTQKKTDLYDSVFGKSLYTVDKQEEIQKKDYKEQINELKEREKLMGRNSVSEAREEQKKTGRGLVLERVNEFKEADRKKMTDMEGTESSTKFFENLELLRCKCKMLLLSIRVSSGQYSPILVIAAFFRPISKRAYV